MAWPDRVMADAWTGTEGVTGKIAEGSEVWARQRDFPLPTTTFRPGPPAHPKNWKDPSIGWGLVLPENTALSGKERAIAADAPEPIRELLVSRPGSPVLRHVPGRGIRDLRRYDRDGTARDIALAGGPNGTGASALPRYLLIYGSPNEVPWEVQFVLNAHAYVGRLSLSGEALENYVHALMTDWSASAARPNHAVIWATDRGPADITRLMRNAIAVPVWRALTDDDDLRAGTRFVDGTQEEATGDALASALRDANPSLVATTSHGMTGPIEDPQALARDLGHLVDAHGRPIDPAYLLGRWQPDGAIWYAHACCSAGGTSRSRFANLVRSDSTLGRTLSAVSQLGPRVASLPEALLGAKRPLRAFVGHVEPTFDWTLRQRETGQFLTDSIKRALWNNLYQPWPIGLALGSFFAQAGKLFTQLDMVIEDASSAGKEIALTCKLMARDREATVILGDPTVALPPI